LLSQNLFRFFSFGRTEAKELELLLPLADAIITDWKIDVFDQNILKIDPASNNDKIGYNKLWEYEY